MIAIGAQYLHHRCNTLDSLLVIFDGFTIIFKRIVFVALFIIQVSEAECTIILFLRPIVLSKHTLIPLNRLVHMCGCGSSIHPTLCTIKCISFGQSTVTGASSITTSIVNLFIISTLKNSRIFDIFLGILISTTTSTRIHVIIAMDRMGTLLLIYTCNIFVKHTHEPPSFSVIHDKSPQIDK